MASPTFPAGYSPVLGDQRSVTFRVKKVQFDDGYEEVYQSGINSTVKSGSLVYRGLTTTEKETIESFLLARKGIEAFFVTLPGESSATLVRSEGYTANTIGGDYWEVSFSYRQVFLNE